MNDKSRQAPKGVKIKFLDGAILSGGGCQRCMQKSVGSPDFGGGGEGGAYKPYRLRPGLGVR